MQCESCNKAVATVHLTDVTNGFKKEIHLCEACANERGVTIKSTMNKPSSIPAEIKPASLVGGDPGDADPGESDLVCPTCGISYRKFRATGKFGCPDDYRAFGHHIVQLLEKIHHKVQHIGKVPARAGQNLAIEKEVQQLRDNLKAAIDAEEYERAAQLRDQIYSLEGRLEKRK
jgi:protein arginine kinase activator